MIFTNLILTNLRTKELGKQIEYYQLGSTNKEAWEIIDLEETRHGTIIILIINYPERAAMGIPGS